MEASPVVVVQIHLATEAKLKYVKRFFQQNKFIGHVVSKECWIELDENAKTKTAAAAVWSGLAKF